jgi:hypothetical protein
MAVATLAMAGSSAVQAVLYLSEFGVSKRTDAFFAAFALYTVFGIFTQSIRVTAVPLLVGERRMSRWEFAGTLSLIAVPAIVACGPLASVLAEVLAPGASASTRSLTEDGLRILGGAMVLQLAAAGAATVLGVAERFGVIAGGYIAGAAAGLITFFATLSAAGELALGWSMLAMAVVTCFWMLVGLRTAPADDRARTASTPQLVANAGIVLGRTLVYFVINGLYLFTLAIATRHSAGDATVLSYAYLFVSYIVAGTSVAVGISRVPDMTRGAQKDWEDVVADTVPHGFRYAILVGAPAVAGLVAAGAALVGHVLPHSLPGHAVSTLETFGALLVPWLVAALAVNFVLPALFALGRARLVNLLSLPLIALHVGATLIGESLFGIDGIVGSMFVGPLLFATVLLAVAGGGRRVEVGWQIVRDSIAFLALAAAAFGVGVGVASALPSGTGRSLLAAAVGGVLYLASLRFAAPRQLSVLVGAGRARSAGASRPGSPARGVR